MCFISRKLKSVKAKTHTHSHTSSVSISSSPAHPDVTKLQVRGCCRTSVWTNTIILQDLVLCVCVCVCGWHWDECFLLQLHQRQVTPETIKPASQSTRLSQLLFPETPTADRVVEMTLSEWQDDSSGKKWDEETVYAVHSLS